MSTLNSVLNLLGSHNLKEDGQGKWRCNSPFRPDADSMSFSLTATDCEHGAYHDFVSDESGSLYKLADQLGVEREQPPARIAVADSKREYTGLADYAAQKGVSAGVFSAAYWREESHKGGKRLAIATESGMRYRDLAGQGVTFYSERGYKPCWYGLTRAIEIARRESRPLVLVNGEPSTVVAQHFSVPAFCHTGGERFDLDKRPDMQTQLVDAITANFRGVHPSQVEIIIGLDCDAAGRAGAGKLVKALRGKGLNARAVDLGLADKGDVADFCKLYGNQAADRLIELPALAVQDAGQLDADGQDESDAPDFEILTLEELDAMPPVAWLLPPLLPEEGITVLYGASGVGKSFYALDMALTVARSKEVLYFAAEGERGYRVRVNAWLSHHKLTRDAVPGFRLGRGMFDLIDKDKRAAIIGALKDKRPDLIVIDTMALTMVGADENSTRDMGKYIAACKAIIRALNCAVLLVHHTGKVGADARGSSALRGAADAMIRLSDNDDVIEVECAKAKDAEPFSTRYIRLLDVEAPGVGKSKVAVAAELDAVTDTCDLTDRRIGILRLLAHPANESGLSVVEIADMRSIPRTSVYRATEQLIKHGLCETAQHGNVAITQLGRDELDRVSGLSGSVRPMSAPVSAPENVSATAFVRVSAQKHEKRESQNANRKNENVQNRADTRTNAYPTTKQTRTETRTEPGQTGQTGQTGGHDGSLLPHISRGLFGNRDDSYYAKGG